MVVDENLNVNTTFDADVDPIEDLDQIGEVGPRGSTLLGDRSPVDVNVQGSVHVRVHGDVDAN